MGSLNSKKPARQWKLLDLAMAAMFVSVSVFLILVFSPLGDTFAASGRRSLAVSSVDPGEREKALKAVAAGGRHVLSLCSPDLADYMPCHDPRRNTYLSRTRNANRERHCPLPDEKLLCLIPSPPEYQIPISWPESFYKVRSNNLPHYKITEGKGQLWMGMEDNYYVFSGGAVANKTTTSWADIYTKKLQRYIPLNDGTIRTALDVGCNNVAAFGGYLLKKNILTMSVAPMDFSKPQMQFVLERGLPAFVAILGTHRLPFPASSFDLVHCSRCMISFTDYGGSYLMEMDRILRAGGYFVLSGPPVRWSSLRKEWEDLERLTQKIHYELVTIDEHTAIWKKPLNHSSSLEKSRSSLFCREDDPNAAWYVPLSDCISRIPTEEMDEEEESLVPIWPERLTKPPRRLSELHHENGGVIMFKADERRWQRRVSHYKEVVGLLTDFSHIRNVLDMNSMYGGFAAALVSDPIWVMNVVSAFGPNTLPIVYDRGLVGVLHDWCEAFSSYPRTYDFIHVMKLDFLIRDKKKEGYRCNLVDVILEMDRLLRPEGTVVIRDSLYVLERVTKVAGALNWTVTYFNTEVGSRGSEKLLVAKKPFRTVQLSSSSSSSSSS